MYLMTKSVKRLLSALNRDRSRQIQSRKYKRRLRYRFSSRMSGFRASVIKFTIEDFLKIFNNVFNEKSLKPLLLLLNRYRSRRLYFRDCIFQLQSRFKALVLLI